MESPYKIIPLSELKVHPDNPRTITKADLKILQESITDLPELLMGRPLIVTPDYTILAGNQRYRAMLNLKMDSAFCYVVDLPPEKQKELMWRDNINNGEWDWDKIEEQGWELDQLQSWGVDVPEYLMKEKRKKTKEDNFTEAPHINIAKPGELYYLVSEDSIHRVIVGDAQDPQTVQRLCGDIKFDAVITDPPYNVNYIGKGIKTKTTIQNDNMGRETFRQFLTDVFNNYVQHAKTACPFYVCHSSSSQRDFEDAMEAAGLKVKNQIIWKKNIATMGWGDYRWMHEPIFYGTIGKKDVPFYGDRKQYTTWNEELTPELAMKIVSANMKRLEKGKGTVWEIEREGNYQHPTQKPLQLIEICLNNSTKPGDVVGDLFSGSGSTLIACEQLGRTCFTAEIDPRFADVTIARYINWKRKAGESYHIMKDNQEIDDKIFDAVIG